MPLLAITAYAASGIDPNAANLSGLETIVQNFLNIATGLAAIFAVLMIIWGGFKYITSRGDMKATDAARSTITWAIVGLIGIIIAYLIILLVRDLTGVDVTRFRIGV